MALLRFWCVCFALLFSFSTSWTQYLPGTNNNVTQLSNLKEYLRYSNLWGYVDSTGREYVLLGHNEGTSIIDISDPANPNEITMIPGPGRDSGTIWREIKTYGNYAYITTELLTDFALTGLQIIDLSDLPNSATYVGRYLWPGVDSTNARAHTLNIDDQGFLYIQGGSAALAEGFPDPGGIRIFNLNDPLNPEPVSTFPDRYVHDSRVVNNFLFAHDIREPGGRIDVIDISDRATPTLQTSIIYPNGGLSHDGWPSEDKNYYVSTDEVAGLTMKIWDIRVLWDTDPDNDDQIELVSEYVASPFQIGHEARVLDNFVFLSNYVLGMKVLDSSDISKPTEVGYFDTFPEVNFPGQEFGFSGNWGVYPYFPSGVIAVSDISTGLHILQFDSVRAGEISGQILDSISGLPVADTKIQFLEADKFVTSDSTGDFNFASNEGTHTVILSKRFYFTDTATVVISAGEIISQNLNFAPNLVDVELSESELNFQVAEGTTDSLEFVIRNVGAAGSLLKYSLEDFNGPLEKLPEMPIENNKSFLTGAKLNTATLTNQPTAKLINTQEADTILVDPPDDLLEGVGGDLIGVYAERTDSLLTLQFEFLNPIDTDSTLLGFAMDLDFDVTTGAFPGLFGALDPTNAIGSEFDVLVDIPGLVADMPNTALLFFGSNDIETAIIFDTLPIAISERVVTLEINLNLIEDDGNMAIAGLSGHFDSEVENTSADFWPDVGHADVGLDPNDSISWLELKTNNGQLAGGEADTVVVKIDAANLDVDDFSGVILMMTNDPDELVVQIPVSLDVVTSVSEDDILPARFALSRNYPNPFNPETRIEFELATQSNVRLEVYNLLGQKIRTLVNGTRSAGSHKVVWDAKDKTGKEVGTGVYVYQMTAGEYTSSQKMLLVR